MFCRIACNAFCVLRAIVMSAPVAQAEIRLERTCSSVSSGLDSARLDVRKARRFLHNADKFEDRHSEDSDSCRADKRYKTWLS